MRYNWCLSTDSEGTERALVFTLDEEGQQDTVLVILPVHPEQMNADRVARIAERLANALNQETPNS